MNTVIPRSRDAECGACCDYRLLSHSPYNEVALGARTVADLKRFDFGFDRFPPRTGVLQNAGETHRDVDRRERVILMLDLIHVAQYNPGPSAGSSGLREIRSRAPGRSEFANGHLLRPGPSRVAHPYTSASSALSRAR